jgi:hypothetical protein
MARFLDDEEKKKQALLALQTADDVPPEMNDAGAAQAFVQATPVNKAPAIPALVDHSVEVAAKRKAADAYDAPLPEPNKVERIIDAITSGMAGFTSGLTGGNQLQQYEAGKRQATQDEITNRLSKAKSLRDEARQQEQNDLAEQQRFIEGRRADTAQQQEIDRANRPISRDIKEGGLTYSLDPHTGLPIPGSQVTNPKPAPQVKYTPMAVTLKNGGVVLAWADDTGHRILDMSGNDISSQVSGKQPISGGDDLQTYLAAKEAELGRPLKAAEKTAAIERYKTLGFQQQQQQLNKVPSLANVPKELVSHASDEQDKTSNTWLEAHQRGEDLGAFIDAARHGNKVAGGYAPVEQVMFTNASQGIKRVNDTELHAIKGAGSAKDRVESFFNGYVTGQPIPESILTDMDTIRKAIMKSADERFKQKTTFTNANTGAGFEADPYKAHGIEPPSNGVPPGKVITSGSTGGWSVKVVK